MIDNRKPVTGRPFQPGRTKPGQDILVRKRAAQFPAVGMTLSSYQQSATGSAGVLEPSRLVTPSFKAPRRRWWRRLWSAFSLKRVVLVLGLVVLLVSSWLAFKFVYNTHKVFGGNIFNALNTTKLRGEDSGRVNILLAGNSADDSGHQGADLTDSIMIMSVDTKNHTAFLLSVPRDLWVNIGDGGHQKINAAYVVGQQNNFNQNGFPAGGMGQLEQVVEQDFGINIDYYALVNYTAFRDAVNAVGGIDVTIKSSDPRGLYDPSIDYATHGPLVKLTNGAHHLNGEQALDLARARGDSDRSYGFAQSDFTRTQNQRMMLVALKSKAVSAGVLSNPAKLSSLADAIGNNVTTDMKLSEVHRLYDLVKDINGSGIQSLSLNSANGQNLLSNYTAPDGESALVPAAGLDDYTDIQNFLNQQLSTDPLVREGATIAVLNATNATGLASRARTALTNKHLSVVAVGDATANQATTTIIDNTNGDKPATRALLKQVYGDNFTATNAYPNYNADFIVVVGNDQIPKLMPTANPNP